MSPAGLPEGLPEAAGLPVAPASFSSQRSSPPPPSSDSPSVSPDMQAAESPSPVKDTQEEASVVKAPEPADRPEARRQSSVLVATVTQNQKQVFRSGSGRVRPEHAGNAVAAKPMLSFATSAPQEVVVETGKDVVDTPREEEARVVQQRAPRVLFDSELEGRLRKLVEADCPDECLVIGVDEETCLLSLLESAPFKGDVPTARFERLAAAAPQDAPRIFLLRLDFESNSPEWLVVSWTPAAACTAWRRTFIDYAAWSLRIAIRFPRPIKEYYAANSALLSWPAFRQAERERERRLRHLATSRACSQARAGGRRYYGLELGNAPVLAAVTPYVPLDVDDDFAERLQQFHRGDVACLEILVDDEDSTLTALSCVYETPGLLQQHVADGPPRYFLLRYQNITAFLFYCPDSENRRERVLYAASKQRVWDAIMAAGITVSQRHDLRSPGEFSEKLFEREGMDSGNRNEPGLQHQQSHHRFGEVAGVAASSLEQDRPVIDAACRENGIVLLVTLPAKAPPPGDGWFDAQILPDGEDSIEAWRKAAGLGEGEGGLTIAEDAESCGSA